LAGLACLLALALGACGKAASHSGEFVVANYTGRGWTIFRMDVSQAKPTALTDEQSNNQEPVWSPDGMRIAFVSDRDGHPEIYTMQPDGSRQTRLTNSEMEKWNLLWSPDGKRIAFMDMASGVGNLYAINSDGSELVTLASQVVLPWMPVWSPDNRRLAFSRSIEAGSELYVVNNDGSGLKKLSEKAGVVRSFCFTPDGQKVLFSLAKPEVGVMGQLFLADLEAGKVTPLADPSGGNIVSAWFTKGNQILMLASEDGRLDFYKMDANGEHQQQLTDNPGIFRLIGLSPDEKKISFIGRSGEGTEAQVMNFDGSELKQVTNLGQFMMQGCWSKDGKYLNLRGNLNNKLEQGNYRNWVVSLDGSFQMEISNFAGEQQVEWRP
jgi:Tol biopolymer transport system component